MSLISERATAQPISTWLVLPLAILPMLCLLWAGAEPSWLWRGALAWIVAVVVKVPLMIGLSLTPTGPRLRGAAAGAISAGTELGIALWVVVRSAVEPDSFDILLFGGAAGSVEALAVLGWGILQRTKAAEVERWVESAKRSWTVRHQVLLERAVAWFGHLGSRSLVAFAIVLANPAIGLLAVLTFATTDGMAAYWHERGADWTDPHTLARYFGIAAALVAVELIALAIVIGLR